MKRLLISVLLLSLTLAFCFFSYSFLQKKTAELDSVLSQCSDFIKSSDTEKAEKSIDEARSFWNENESKFRILVEGAFCETVENCLDRLSFCFTEKEYTEAKNSINECRNALRQILEVEKISIEVVL
ncbi:MAG: DUF4363 family protein [Clostridia bacterium]|nr:DUF4363 family protein [Clostridia bacterium]